MRLDHLLSKEHTPYAWPDECSGGRGGLLVEPSTCEPSAVAVRALVRLIPCGVSCGGGCGTGLVAGGGQACSGTGGDGTLLGPEESGAGWPDGWCGAGFLVVVWLLDSGREHLCSCLLRSMTRCPFVGCCVVVICLFVCFVVLVCVATSYEGRMVDALASRADEGRRSLR